MRFNTNDTFTFITEVYRLKNLVRYNNCPRIRDESVAEHSFFVALIVIHLHRLFKFNLEKAVLIAIAHDLPEIYISDVPNNVKREFEAINTALKCSELRVINEELTDIKDLFEDCVEQDIVKLADLYSVLQYTDSEVNLGNDNFRRLSSDIYEPINKLQIELLKIRR